MTTQAAEKINETIPTKQYLLSVEQYRKLTNDWKREVNGPRKHALACEYHIIYALLRRAPLDLMYGQITNRQKIKNSYRSQLVMAMESLVFWKDVSAMRKHFPRADHVFDSSVLTQEVWDQLVPTLNDACSRLRRSNGVL